MQNLKNRIEKLEKAQTDSSKCVCTIGQVKELLTTRTLPEICSNCGNKRTDKEIKVFADWRVKSDQRLENIEKQVKERMQKYEYQ